MEAQNESQNGQEVHQWNYKNLSGLSTFPKFHNQSYPMSMRAKESIGLLEKSAKYLITAQEMLQKISEPVVWAEICMHQYVQKSKYTEDLWVMGLEKFSHSGDYLDQISSYYLAEKKYHKALSFIGKNGNKNKNGGIIAAFGLAQYGLVLDFYQMMNSAENKHLNEEFINIIAYSAMQISQYDIAEKLYVSLVEKKGGKSLPSLKESLLSQFGNEAKMDVWAKSISASIREKTSLTEISIGNWVTYGSILMHQEKYSEALDILLKVRSSYF